MSWYAVQHIKCHLHYQHVTKLVTFWRVSQLDYREAHVAHLVLWFSALNDKYILSCKVWHDFPSRQKMSHVIRLPCVLVTLLLVCVLCVWGRECEFVDKVLSIYCSILAEFSQFDTRLHCCGPSGHRQIKTCEWGCLMSTCFDVFCEKRSRQRTTLQCFRGRRKLNTNWWLRESSVLIIDNSWHCVTVLNSIFIIVLSNTYTKNV